MTWGDVVCFVRRNWRWLAVAGLLVWAKIHPDSLTAAIGQILDWIGQAFLNLFRAFAAQGPKVTKVTGDPVNLIADLGILSAVCAVAWIWWIKPIKTFIFGSGSAPKKKGKK